MSMKCEESSTGALVLTVHSNIIVTGFAIIAISSAYGAVKCHSWQFVCGGGVTVCRFVCGRRGVHGSKGWITLDKS